MSAVATTVRRQVLLVDDDQEEYLIVGDLLRSFPMDRFELTWAATYTAGLEALLSSRFDVCLVDYRLGGQSGLDFLSEARAAGSQTQLVLLTGAGDREVDLMATERGAADYLVKGQITAELLERSLRYAIERGHVLEALRASEEFLRTANERYTLAADAAGIGVWEWDLAGNTLRWDDQMYRLYGRSRCAGEEPYSLWATSLHGEDRERSEREINDALRDRSNFDTEFRIVLPTGEVRYVKAAAQIQFDAAGSAIRMTGVNFDVTARKCAELDFRHTSSLLREATVRAERANAAKSEFLATMSHEIRTPLSAVVGMGYLLGHTGLNEEQRSFVGKINSAGRTLLAVINNVLDLSKIEAGEMLLEDAELDVVHLIEGVGQLLTPSARAKGLALRVGCATDLPRRLRGDAVRLRQIATNLLNNAIKFTATGQIDLELSHSMLNATDLVLRLAVRDTGIGIDADAVARLFKPFFQADASTTRRFGGTGLGLSIVRRLVDLMGGKIGVTSTVGVGSEFWAEVPLRVAGGAQSVGARQAVPDSAAARSLAGARILVVDDSDISREVAQHILERQGAVVTTGGTGTEALERLRKSPDAFDIVFMDVQMPQMDGNEATRRIRAELGLAALPIIALTAGALVSERELSLLAGMNDFLTKPFEPVELIGMVRRYLDLKIAVHDSVECRVPATGG
jgi:PAS domain S-box-containing protein